MGSGSPHRNFCPKEGSQLLPTRFFKLKLSPPHRPSSGRKATISPASAVASSDGIIGCCALWIDRSHFKDQSAIEARIATGELRRFLKAAREDEPISANHFL